MKKVLFISAVCIAVCIGLASTGTGFNKNIISPPFSCTCMQAIFNSCLNKTIHYTFEYDCSTRVLTGIDATDDNGNPLDVQGLVVNSSNKTFIVAVNDPSNCNLVYMSGTYNFSTGCGVTLTITECFPGGGC